MKINNSITLNSQSYINIYNGILLYNDEIYYHTKDSVYKSGDFEKLLYTNPNEEIIKIYIQGDKMEFLSLNRYTSSLKIMSLVNDTFIEKQVISLKGYDIDFIYDSIIKHNYLLLIAEINNTDKAIIIDINSCNFKILNENNYGIEFYINEDALILNKSFDYDEKRKDLSDKSYIIQIPFINIFNMDEIEIDATKLHEHRRLEFKLECENLNGSYKLMFIHNNKVYISEYNYKNGNKVMQTLSYDIQSDELKIMVPYNMNRKSVSLSDNNILFYIENSKIYNSELQCIYKVKEEYEIKKLIITIDENVYLILETNTTTEIYYIETSKNLEYKILELGNEYIYTNEINLNIILSEYNAYLVIQKENAVVELQAFVKN